MTDDLDAGREDLIARRMVEVKMRVDDGRHRLVMIALISSSEDPRRRRGYVVVDDHHVAIVDDDRRVADDRERTGADWRDRRLP